MTYTREEVDEANRRAEELCLQFHAQAPGDDKFWNEAVNFVMRADAAFQMAKVMVYFAYIEFDSARRDNREADNVNIEGFCNTAKAILYQHFILNSEKYGLKSNAPRETQGPRGGIGTDGQAPAGN